MTRFEETGKLIKDQKESVCVIGLGYIGLPTALLYAKRGLSVKGIDIDAQLLDNLTKGIVHSEEAVIGLAHQYLKRIVLSSSYDTAEKAQVFVLCLPSPIDAERKPILGPLEAAIDELAKRVSKGALFIIESTVPVGTTEWLADVFGKRSGFEADEDYWFAHCPERVLPGRLAFEFETNHRLVGGVTAKSTQLAKTFLTSMFNPKLVHPTCSRVSEASKLAENAFRDVNIAYANELAKVCSSVGIDVNEVIELANLHPRVSILKPGIGVGGYCLPKDGWLLVNPIGSPSAEALLIPAARKVNDGMPSHVFEIVRQIRRMYPGERTGLLGLAFKENVADTRNSPTASLVDLFISAGEEVIVYDPLVDDDFGAKRAKSLDEILDACGVIVLCVGHDALVKQLRSIDLSGKILVDPGNSVPHLRNRVRLYVGVSGLGVLSDRNKQIVSND